VSSHAVAAQLLRTAWSFPFARVLAPQAPVTLLYHGVPAGEAEGVSSAVFEQHIVFLKQHFDFVSPRDDERRRRPTERTRILLTFDDGFRNNAEVAAPILRKHRVPAVFFVSSRHATPGRYLWFSYLSALEKRFTGAGFSFRGMVFKMSPDERQKSVQRLRGILLGLVPHPTAMYEAMEGELPHLEDFVSQRELADGYAGMTAQHVADLSADPLFSIGVHTVDHPYLTKCDPVEALRQIQANRAWLEAACGARCDAIAYPGGDYDAGVLRMCRGAAFTRGYAVVPRIDHRSRLELPRIGIYADSTDVLGFKVQWGSLLRTMRLPVG
jgi:peptidoglycan/xylan/chitin deacetylase (PgdA/CDA1 family)